MPCCLSLLLLGVRRTAPAQRLPLPVPGLYACCCLMLTATYAPPPLLPQHCLQEVAWLEPGKEPGYLLAAPTLTAAQWAVEQVRPAAGPAAFRRLHSRWPPSCLHHLLELGCLCRAGLPLPCCHAVATLLPFLCPRPPGALG